MPAYLIVDTRITDPDEYERYKALARPMAERHGGTYRARGGEMQVFEDDLWSPSRLVVVEFPDMASGRAFMASEDYAPVRALRRANAACTVVLVEGVG